MTRIDFYSNAEPKLHVACQLVAKAVQQQLRVVVYAPDDGAAHDIDRLLWTFHATGFVPHTMAAHALASETPVVIAREESEITLCQIMVNLHEEAPASFSRFERLIEIVGKDDLDRQLARNRYRHYRDRGY